VWSVLGAWLAIGFGIFVLGAVMVADSGGTGPRFRGLHQANAVWPWVFLAVAVAWLVALLPVLPIATRIRILRWCRIVVYSTGATWLAWTIIAS
jgi:hypothetical protein